jgi:hypothetical protein
MSEVVVPCSREHPWHRHELLCVAPKFWTYALVSWPATNRDEDTCEFAWNKGSVANSMMIAMIYVTPISRACNRSSFARPYIWRLMSFSRVIWPSVWPFDQGCTSAAATAR